MCGRCARSLAGAGTAAGAVRLGGVTVRLLGLLSTELVWVTRAVVVAAVGKIIRQSTSTE